MVYLVIEDDYSVPLQQGKLNAGVFGTRIAYSILLRDASHARTHGRVPYTGSKTWCISCAKRTGKQRYPSEKKRLRTKHKELLSESKGKDKFEGTWRLFKLAVSHGANIG
ncbi:hypothetical protein LR48_Vigan07g230600 [Vigna angularis]|uniref:Uncharacterized protein n=1 Tax=Phaseolus angularis TaxID=3914 RepID=A0A0L9V175_PHAAN|nr:hypothetical protein LR48_Vigan07g230600 [Vigna angularis]